MSTTEQRLSCASLLDGVVEGLVPDGVAGVTTGGEGVTAGAGDAPGVVTTGHILL